MDRLWPSGYPSASQPRMAAGEPRTTPDLLPLLPVYTVIFVGFIGYSLMITVFTPMLMYAHNGMLSAHSRLSHRIIMLGVLLSLYPLGQFLGSPVLGALSDRFGRRPVLLASLTATTVGYALIVAALALQSLPLLLGASLLAGLSEANVVIAQSAIADVTTAASRARLAGYVYLSSSLAYVVGPLAGGKLADSSLVPWFDYATPFWVVLGLLLLALAWVGLAFRETHAPRAEQTVDYIAAFANLFDVLNDHRLRALYAVNFLLYLAIYGFFRCYPMYLVDEFRLNVSRVSEFIAWVAVPIVLANLGLTDFLAKRVEIRQIAIASAVLTGAFMMMIPVPPQVDALWVTLFLASLALAVCLPACATMISVAVSSSEQGRAMGNNQSVQVGAEALSAVLGGLLAAVATSLPLVALGLVAIAAAGFLAWSRPRTDEDAPE
jgi:MFS family permease